MPRRQILIVDGYNVIRNNERYTALGEDFGSEVWNKARQTLVNDAAYYAQGTYERCTVVFDGAGNPFSQGKPRHVAGVDVIFSPAGVSADTVIEKLAHEARDNGYEAVVVSSDLTIQSTVFGNGVSRMSANNFGGASQAMERDWREQSHGAPEKMTLADRLDPKTAEKLRRMLHPEE